MSGTRYILFQSLHVGNPMSSRKHGSAWKPQDSSGCRKMPILTKCLCVIAYVSVWTKVYERKKNPTKIQNSDSKKYWSH